MGEGGGGAVGGNPAARYRREQAVARQIAGRASARDAACRTARRVEVGHRFAVGTQGPALRVDFQAALGVE